MNDNIHPPMGQPPVSQPLEPSNPDTREVPLAAAQPLPIQLSSLQGPATTGLGVPHPVNLPVGQLQAPGAPEDSHRVFIPHTSTGPALEPSLTYHEEPPLPMGGDSHVQGHISPSPIPEQHTEFFTPRPETSADDTLDAGPSLEPSTTLPLSTPPQEDGLPEWLEGKRAVDLNLLGSPYSLAASLVREHADLLEKMASFANEYGAPPVDFIQGSYSFFLKREDEELPQEGASPQEEESPALQEEKQPHNEDRELEDEEFEFSVDKMNEAIKDIPEEPIREGSKDKSAPKKRATSKKDAPKKGKAGEKEPIPSPYPDEYTDEEWTNMSPQRRGAINRYRK